MMNDEEINKRLDIFNKQIKKKIYLISALKLKGLKAIKKILVGHAN